MNIASVDDRKFARWVPGLRAYYFIMPIMLCYLLVEFWPAAIDPETMKPCESTAVDIVFLPPIFISPESRLLIIVILAGAIGSFVHGATSLTTYLGNRTLVRSWTWWYWMRPLIGMGIALLFYFAVRGGFLLLVTQPTTYDKISPFGIAAIAGLAGMFSKQATDKLREVFDSLFKSHGDEQRGDKLWRGRLVSDVMIPRKDIRACEVENEQDAQVSIRDLFDLVEKGYSRIPVFNKENGSLRYLIHQSLLFRYITHASIEASDKTPQEAFELAGHTLEDLRDWEETRKTMTEALAFVKPGANVGEAKQKMDEVEGCQDVFVTEKGKSKDRVLGWLTNVDISKLSKA